MAFLRTYFHFKILAAKLASYIEKPCCSDKWDLWSELSRDGCCRRSFSGYLFHFCIIFTLFSSRLTLFVLIFLRGTWYGLWSVWHTDKSKVQVAKISHLLIYFFYYIFIELIIGNFRLFPLRVGAIYSKRRKKWLHCNLEFPLQFSSKVVY